MKHLFFILSSVMGILAVGIGAFGAHGLKNILESNNRMSTFETGVQYHFYHTIAMLIVAVLLESQPSKWLNYSGWAFFIGIIIFSFSLYALSLTNFTKLGAITPIGGVAFILGWFFILMHFIKK